MAGATRGRTAALAVLFVLGLLLPGTAVLQSATAELSLHQSDVLSVTRDGWTAVAVLAPVLPAPTRSQPLRPKAGPWTGMVHADGATQAFGPSVPGALLVSALLLPAGHRAPAAAPWRPNSSRAPPSAL